MPTDVKYIPPPPAVVKMYHAAKDDPSPNGADRVPLTPEEIDEIINYSSSDSEVGIAASRHLAHRTRLTEKQLSALITLANDPEVDTRLMDGYKLGPNEQRAIYDHSPKNARGLLRTQEMSPELLQTALDPEDHYQKIKDIVFGGKHPNEILHEAFQEWLRSPHPIETCPNGHRGPFDGQNVDGYHCPHCEGVDRYGDPGKGKGYDGTPIKAVAPAFVGTPVHIWTPESKAKISLHDDDRGIPGHMQNIYRDIPVKKLGFEPGQYGEIPTQNNEDFKGNKAIGRDLNDWVEPADTFKDVVRKSEEDLNDLSAEYWKQIQRIFTKDVSESCEQAKTQGKKILIGHVDDCDVYVADFNRACIENDEGDLVMGGNHMRWPFIPDKEIWIDANMAVEQLPHILLHEVVETHLMTEKDYSYDKAHNVANDFEESKEEELLGKSELDPNAPRAASVWIENWKGDALWGQRRKDGKWSLIGGHIEQGEDPVDGAIREMHEECGLTPSVIHEVSIANGGEHGELPVHIYRAIARGAPTVENDPDKEFASLHWVNCTQGVPQSILQNLAHPRNVVLIRLGLDS